jgi:nucleotide-binding universal stress UspA family protein
MSKTDYKSLDAEAQTSQALEESSLKIRHILAPTDLSEESRKGLNYAIRLAQHFGANLTILHVYTSPDISESGADSDAARRFRRQQKPAEELLNGIWEEVRARHVPCDTVFEWGQPNDLILAAARNLAADLIVLSTHDFHWLQRFLSGSDAEKILHRAPCPVLIVHEHEPDFAV